MILEAKNINSGDKSMERNKKKITTNLIEIKGEKITLHLNRERYINTARREACILILYEASN